ncbi:Putative RNA methylase family UPF0020 [Peptoclostridium litorale DSM 5388]|uniref:RNA methyltransferase n=1 Tax=Peptoclostridium litorale DSM 5388 TaxID=1121324 RepID=A0A069RBM8_PEPLI|nr:hypothetical protein [Peptoclostridium litorale]KDR94163.1 RNA methyltransferase [Peptoclostridium litorale DSM 5388]SIN81676.1 Putative RNA methylase family UPF0020 [Peptoclostridium litorale DSM 5388]
MKDKTYLYNVNYPEHEETLWAIEARTLFKTSPKEKVFFSDVAVNPSTSPYIKNRLEIRHKTPTFEELLLRVERDENTTKNSVIKYLKLASGDPYAEGRKALYKELCGKFKEPVEGEVHQVTYGTTFHKGLWYFGELLRNNGLWRRHDKRPHTYSNSLKANMAKVLVNIAGQGDASRSIIDPCCGAGTVLLEGCFAGCKIAGSDINEKMARSATRNLEHFGYAAKVSNQAIQDITEHYDASIVDLPYGLRSQITRQEQGDIIKNAKRISDRAVIVSSEDITSLLSEQQLKIVDACKIIKSVNKKFTRFIWVCE